MCVFLHIYVCIYAFISKRNEDVHADKFLNIEF